jgi:hypothetical protein
MPTYFQSTLEQQYLGLNAGGGGLQISKDKFARRAKFVPLEGDTSVLWAEVPVPSKGSLYDIAVLLNGVTPKGKLHVSTVNPSYSYEGFFLYAILNPIEVETITPAIKMFRKLEMHGCGYSTDVLNYTKLYLVLTDPPALPMVVVQEGQPAVQADGILADITVTVGNG